MEETVALLEIVPVPPVVTRISTLAVPPLRIVPRLQVTVLVPEQLPWLGVAETSVTLAGSVSTTVVPVAAAGPLFVTTIVWGVIYDTEYAMADRDEDLKIGVRSIAILFGDLDRMFVGALQLMFLGGLILVGQSTGLGPWFLAGVGAAAALFLYQQHLIRDRDSVRCFLAFKNNATLGLCVFMGILLDYLFRP